MALATGGTITVDGLYTVHKFTASGTFGVLYNFTGEVLVVGGGGGGGRFGGGGGGGGVVHHAALELAVGNYDIIIGDGGAGDTDQSNQGVNGASTTGLAITALGGGGGGSRNDSTLQAYPGSDGGSGGGGSPGSTGSLAGGSSTQGDSGGGTGYGEAGGAGSSVGNRWAAGGGGGAAEVGEAAPDANNGGDGGDGYGTDILVDSSTVYYGGGGGGGIYSGGGGTVGVGGAGGGGAGSSTVSPATAGSDNTGGGGGGGGYQKTGGKGGSGIVIIRYLTNLPGGGNDSYLVCNEVSSSDVLSTYIDGVLVKDILATLIKNYKTTRIGSATDYCEVNSVGVLTLTGTAKRHLSMRPFIEIGKIAQNSKPTIAQRGASSGYSLPIYNNDDEEIYVSEYIAGRWDGASDIQMNIIGYLASAEDAGDAFKLEVAWMNKSTGDGVVSDSVTTTSIVTSTTTGRIAQYSIYKVDFTIDWDVNTPDILASDYFAARIRRVAVGAGNTEMSGEFVITLVELRYQVDKMFKE